jgi:hypothetical protein
MDDGEISASHPAPCCRAPIGSIARLLFAQRGLTFDQTARAFYQENPGQFAEIWDETLGPITARKLPYCFLELAHTAESSLLPGPQFVGLIGFRLMTTKRILMPCHM